MASENPPPLGKCTVISCSKLFYDKPEGECPFFSFPTTQVSQIWKEKCGVAADHEIADSKVCAEHFRFEDFSDGTRTKLKEGVLPRLKLGWMLGEPEVRLDVADPSRLEKVQSAEIGTKNSQSSKLVADDSETPADFYEVKDAVDEHERLRQYFEKLEKEQVVLNDKVKLYDRKIGVVEREINKTEEMIYKKTGLKKSVRGVEKNLICKVFSQAQIDVLLGKRKVVWSYDDMARAFTLRHIGNKECYLYLKNTLNMPLPSLSSVQKWVASNKISP